jgi:tRNA (guanine-N7-)-methyltransferase
MIEWWLHAPKTTAGKNRRLGRGGGSRRGSLAKNGKDERGGERQQKDDDFFDHVDWTIVDGIYSKKLLFSRLRIIRAKNGRQMRNSKKLMPAAAAVEIVPQDYCVALDLDCLFPRSQPLEVDIGCGDGAFLVALATQHPDWNFLGIERLLGRTRSACRRVVRANLSNARLLRLESSYAIRYLLPPESVARFHLNFPDPWPKRRHQRRRVLSEEFLRAVHGALRNRGTLRFLTDRADYAAEVGRLTAAESGFICEKTNDERDFPLTTFEKKFRQGNIPIYQLLLRKISGVRQDAASQWSR